MKFLFSCLLTTFILTGNVTAQASQLVVGTLSRDIHYNGLTIVLENKQRYFLTCTDPEALMTLNRMTPGDLIIGTGTIDKTRNILNLDSMDYVGLQKVLGLWHADNGFIEFKTFSDLNVYSKVFEASQSPNNKKQFKYSITPGTGNDWVLFLSDNDSTTLGTIQITRETATIKVLDSKTGQIKQTVRLIKVSN